LVRDLPNEADLADFALLSTLQSLKLMKNADIIIQFFCNYCKFEKHSRTDAPPPTRGAPAVHNPDEPVCLSGNDR
jgi:hypothetical protein